MPDSQTLIDESKAEASAAGLRYVTDQMPGAARMATASMPVSFFSFIVHLLIGRWQLLAVTPEVAHQRLDADTVDNDRKRYHNKR